MWYGPHGHENACILQGYISDTLIHCVTTPNSALATDLIFHILVAAWDAAQDEEDTHLTKHSRLTLFFEGPPTITGLSWTLNRWTTTLYIAWGQCSAEPCMLYMRGEYLWLGAAPLNAAIIAVLGTAELVCATERVGQVLACAIPQGTPLASASEKLAVSVRISGLPVGTATVKLVPMRPPNVTTVTASLPDVALPPSAHLHVPALVHGTVLSLTLEGSELHFPAAAVRVWLRESRALRDPWHVECRVHEDAYAHIKCDLLVVHSAHADVPLATPLQFVVQVGALGQAWHVPSLSLTFQGIEYATASHTRALATATATPTPPAMASPTPTATPGSTASPTATTTALGPFLECFAPTPGAELCGGHGRCVSLECRCDAGYFGPHCTVPSVAQLPLPQTEAFSHTARPNDWDLYAVLLPGPAPQRLTVKGEWEAAFELFVWTRPSDVGNASRAQWTHPGNHRHTASIPLGSLPSRTAAPDNASLVLFVAVRSHTYQNYTIAFAAGGTFPLLPAASHPVLELATLLIGAGLAVAGCLVLRWRKRMRHLIFSRIAAVEYPTDPDEDAWFSLSEEMQNTHVASPVDHSGGLESPAGQGA